jgi:lysophospholipase L1-like esterase
MQHETPKPKRHRVMKTAYSARVTRIVCIGDSFTEGVEDELRADGRYRGWSDRLAFGLAQQSRLTGGSSVYYANLAVRGKLLNAIVEDQLPAALAMRPDILTFHAGGNDVLRPGTDLPDLFDRYDAAVAQLASSGAKLLVFTSLSRAGGTGRVADRLAARFELFNDNARSVALGHGAQIVDVDKISALADRRFWHEDRLHLNNQGHARIAAIVLNLLDVTDEAILGGPVGWWAEPLPVAAKRPRVDHVAEDFRWFRAHLVPWAIRRIRGVSSGDGVLAKDPELRPIID